MALDLNKIRPVSTGIQGVGQQAPVKKAEAPKIDTFALAKQGLGGKFAVGSPVGGLFSRPANDNYDPRGLALCKTVGISNAAGCENLRPAIVQDLEALMKETA